MSTLMPFCNMGVITMKMISNTNITSTIGVTLMSELTLAPSFRLANAIDFSVRQWPVVSGQLPVKPAEPFRPGWEGRRRECPGAGQQLSGATHGGLPGPRD